MTGGRSAPVDAHCVWNKQGPVEALVPGRNPAGLPGSGRVPTVCRGLLYLGWKIAELIRYAATVRHRFRVTASIKFCDYFRGKVLFSRKSLESVFNQIDK